MINEAENKKYIKLIQKEFEMKSYSAVYNARRIADVQTFKELYERKCDERRTIDKACDFFVELEAEDLIEKFKVLEKGAVPKTWLSVQGAKVLLNSFYSSNWKSRTAQNARKLLEIYDVA